jgi:hypothetical protein
MVATAARTEQDGEQVDDQGEGDQGRGAIPGRRRRARRALPGGKVSGRKFQLPDAVFERLALQALKKRTSPSAIVADILDRELPKHRIATDE